MAAACASASSPFSPAMDSVGASGRQGARGLSGSDKERSPLQAPGFPGRAAWQALADLAREAARAREGSKAGSPSRMLAGEKAHSPPRRDPPQPPEASAADNHSFLRTPLIPPRSLLISGSVLPFYRNKFYLLVGCRHWLLCELATLRESAIPWRAAGGRAGARRTGPPNRVGRSAHPAQKPWSAATVPGAFCA